MSVKTEHTVRCNHTNCTETLSVSAPGATIHALWEKAKKAGWAWKNAETQYCPDHAPKAEAKPAKKAPAKKAKAYKPAAKKTSAPKRKVATLPGVPDVSDRPAE